MFDLTGKCALVTGASGGIGGAIARALHGAGATVGLSGTRVEPLEALAAELGSRAHVLPCNLSDPAAVDGLPKAAIEAMGSLDILVNNAGITRDQIFMRMSDEDWQSVIDVNLTATMRLCRGAIRGMMKARWGRIVNISSIVGATGNPGQANYAATKGYVQALGEGLHAELKPHGVDVLCVAPGPVHSGFANRAGMTMPSATTPDVVASSVWTTLGRRTTVVPGAQGKLLTASLKTLPRPVRSAILARVMESMRNADGP